jgi:hypothetical protein
MYCTGNKTKGAQKENNAQLSAVVTVAGVWRRLWRGSGEGEEFVQEKKGERERQIHDTDTPINRKNETRKSGEKNANNGARRNV